MSRPSMRCALACALIFNAAAAASALAGPCDEPFTAAHAIQGSGAASPLAGSTVTVQGVVVGDYEGSTTGALRGFYLQDAVGDGNAATSDAVFVFNGNNDNVSLGQIVRLSGLWPMPLQATRTPTPAAAPGASTW